MKKIFMMMVMALLALTSTCFAQINDDDLRIGDVYIWQSMEELVKLYNKPLYIKDAPPKGSIAAFKINDKELITHSVGGKEVTTLTISNRENSNWATPRGIGTQSTKTDVLNSYGKPDKIITIEGFETLVYLTPEKFYDSHPTFISNQGIIEFIIDNDKVLRVNMSKQIKAKMIR